MVALVTGASRGIGRAISVALAREGYDLVLVGRDEDRLAKTREAVIAARPAASGHTVGLDLAALDAPRRLATEVSQAFGRLDVLVNNAGVAPGGPFTGYSFGEWDRVMAINARAPFFVTQALLPLLRQAMPGYVFNLCSVVSRKGYANQSLYAASKHAILGFTKSLAREIPTSELRVHAILPGGTDTEMIRGVRPDIDTSELIAPEDVANVVIDLVRMRGNAVIDQVEIRRAAKPA